MSVRDDYEGGMKDSNSGLKYSELESNRLLYYTF